MGLERIISKIKDDAEQKAEAIIADARAQAADIVDKGTTDAADVREQILESAKLDADRERERILTLGRLEQRKLELTARRQIIDQAFKQAITAFSDMPDDEYFSLLADAVIDNASGGEQLVFNNSDRNRVPGNFVDRINKELAARNIAPVKLSDQTRLITGGIILQGDRVEINLSLDSNLAQIRDEVTIEVAAMLFSKEGG